MKRRDERPTRRGFELTRTPFETKRRDSSSLLAAREQGRVEASFLLLLLALSSSLALAGRVLRLLPLSSPVRFEAGRTLREFREEFVRVLLPRGGLEFCNSFPEVLNLEGRVLLAVLREGERGGQLACS